MTTVVDFIYEFILAQFTSLRSTSPLRYGDFGVIENVRHLQQPIVSVWPRNELRKHTLTFLNVSDNGRQSGST